MPHVVFLVPFVVLLPPTLARELIRVGETDLPTSIMCINPNSEEVSNGIQWFRVNEPISGPSSLAITSRESAGRYECRLHSLINGETASVIGEVIVECELLLVVVVGASLEDQALPALFWEIKLNVGGPGRS